MVLCTCTTPVSLVFGLLSSVSVLLNQSERHNEQTRLRWHSQSRNEQVHKSRWHLGKDGLQYIVCGYIAKAREQEALHLVSFCPVFLKNPGRCFDRSPIPRELSLHPRTAGCGPTVCYAGGLVLERHILSPSGAQLGLGCFHVVSSSTSNMILPLVAVRRLYGSNLQAPQSGPNQSHKLCAYVHSLASLVGKQG